MSIGMSDTILYDRSRFRNNGTFSNVTWSQLPSGLWVMGFNGTTSYVEIADSPSMRMTRGGTIVAWVYARTIGEGGYFIHKGTSTIATNGYLLGQNTNNSISAYLDTSAIVSTDNALPYNIWKFVSFTFISGTRKIYVNAVDVTSTGGTGSNVLPPNVAGVVTIGNRAGATDRTFDGQIALPRIYNRVLSATEIARIYNSQRGLFNV